MANDGVLKQPESGSGVYAWVTDTGPRMRSYDDVAWVFAHNYMDSDHWAWVTAQNYYDQLQKPQPPIAIRNDEMEYDVPTGTVTILFSRFLLLTASSEINALQIRPSERWTMGFLLELGFNTNSQAGLFVDGWPRKTYPYLDNDASWWPKLVIDLSNPPVGFST